MMIDRILHTIKNLPWRAICIYLLVLISYVGFLMATFVDYSWLSASTLIIQVASLLLMWICLNLWYVDIHNSKIPILIGVCSVIGLWFLWYIYIYVWWASALWYDFKWHIAAWILFLAAMMLLIYNKRMYDVNSVHVRSRALMHTGIWMYGLMTSAIIACLVVWTYAYIPFDCEQLQDYKSSIFSSVTDPLTSWFKNIQLQAWWLFDFLDADIGSVVMWDGYTGDVVAEISDMESDSSSVVEQRILEWLWNGWWGIAPTQPQAQTWSGSWLLWYVDDLKNNVVWQLLSDQDLINSSICEWVIEVLVQRRNDWGIKLPVVAILFVLLSPFVWFAMLLVSVLSYILFMIGKKTHIRKTHRVLMEVEEVV